MKKYDGDENVSESSDSLEVMDGLGDLYYYNTKGKK